MVGCEHRETTLLQLSRQSLRRESPPRRCRRGRRPLGVAGASCVAFTACAASLAPVAAGAGAAAAEGAWSRRCGWACPRYRVVPPSSLFPPVPASVVVAKGIDDDLERQRRAARRVCEADASCAGVVDFTGNGGGFAICLPAEKGQEDLRWPRVCVDRLDHSLVPHALASADSLGEQEAVAAVAAAAAHSASPAEPEPSGAESSSRKPAAPAASVSAPSTTLDPVAIAAVAAVEAAEQALPTVTSAPGVTAAAAAAAAAGGLSQAPIPDPFAYHKDVFPPDRTDYLALFLSAIGLVIAAGGGIGGGGILVPLYMMVLGFHPKHAIALSNVTIFGSAIVNVIFNVRKYHPDGRPYIDWDIIVMMEPSTITGAVLGALVSKFLPDFILTTSLACVLLLMGYKTMNKGMKMYGDESAKLRGSPLKAFQGDFDFEEQIVEDKRDDIVEAALLEKGRGEAFSPKAALPWMKILLLALCFGGSVAFTLLKGNQHFSLLGVQCGSNLFWLLSVATVPYTLMFAALFRAMLLAETARRHRSNRVYKGAIEWDANNTLKYPLISTIAGLFAGLFGIGGGVVKGPLMLALGVDSLTSAATAATMILFTSSAACVSFLIFGLLELQYGVVAFFTGMICTAIGQLGFNAWMRSASRQSPPVLSIGSVICVSALLVGVEAIGRFTEADSVQELFRHTSVCGSVE
eukprot:TRINITY_DN15083_c3_g2_i1.p1 TRINITY_DN15083_c3_g2~~TRINITY_DN15083_c3_g2_i1.p1  ORF type:complete len:691 (-),score=149.82 TRINITY_DN15083_c3_g2_i1:194-2266(-)